MPFDRPGGLFENFDQEFEHMNRMMDRMFSSMRGADWASIPLDQPLYYGVSVNIGPDGVPHIEQFGNVRPGQQKLGAGVREPFVTSIIDDASNKLRVTAEMPGIDKEGIKVEVLDDALHIHAEGEGRSYEKTLPISVEVDPDSATARYNNGVLEVTLDVQKSAPHKGREVKVE